MARYEAQAASGRRAKLEEATFAAGCFWGVEDVFMRVRGVKETVAGYTGGKTGNPTYKDVCTDTTGHAEAVRMKFDPKEVTYRELLLVFFSIHDPVIPHEAQYRSAIFYHTEEQRRLAEKAKAGAEKENGRPVVTEISKASAFYRAEEHHQKYDRRHGFSCHILNPERIRHLLREESAGR